jgi:glycosyltransferase involved in cell wall biosynthesis
MMPVAALQHSHGPLNQPAPRISVVIPLKDEEGSLEELHRRLVTVFTELGERYEVIFVDDGSTDHSMEVLRRIHAADANVRVIQFRRNFGKAAALSAGFNAARGSLVFTLDADLQDDPKEIPRFLQMLDEDYDLVSGWKQKRHDPLSKRLPSKLFNAVTSRMTGVRLHDFNCGFKGYRAEVVRELDVYGELHRYIPALAGWKGFRVGELVVEHHPRRFGQSKYGFERLARGFFDLLTVMLLTKFSKRPLHLFGMLGVGAGLVGTAALVYLSILWLLGMGPIGNRPLLIFGVLLLISGMQLISLGMLSEMITKLDHRSETDHMVFRRLPESEG